MVESVIELKPAQDFWKRQLVKHDDVCFHSPHFSKLTAIKFENVEWAVFMQALKLEYRVNDSELFDPLKQYLGKCA